MNATIKLHPSWLEPLSQEFEQPYMQKLAVGPGYADGTIDISKSVSDNIRSIADAKGVPANEIIACVLDRPRHDGIIDELRSLGCGVKLISDGDVAGVIAVTDPDTGIDVYLGSGGAPEGVLAASAIATTRSRKWRRATASSLPPELPTARC